MCFTCLIFNPFQTQGNWLHENGSENALEIPEAVDAAGDTSTSYSMSVGDNFSGTLSFYLDWDWVKVNLTAGVTYTFTMTANSMLDPYLYLFNQDGNLVTYNDDISYPSNLNAQITYTPTSSGTFYIAADSHYNSSSYTGSTVDTGTYSLTMSGGGTNPPPPSSNDLLDSITIGYTAPTSINVYFVPGGVSFDDPFDTPQTTSTWSTYEQQQAMLAFETFENVANVNFNVVTNPNQADFFMVESTDPDSSLGYWGVGGTSVTINGTSYNNLDGHGVFYNGGQGWTTLGQAQGGYGFITMIHEIGHGMGLAHPHDTGGTSSIMDGVTASFGSLGNFDLNQGIYTTMSYNDGWQTAPHGASPSDNYGWQGTPMAMDIAVLQSLYGANTTFNNGNDTYELFTVNQTAFSHAYYSTIWDSGGIDTIVNPGLLSSIIDLREAPLTYTANGGGYVSYVTGVHGGFTIAAGAVIENATGGQGNDTIIGNDVANVLYGRGGSDIFFGGNGNDSIYGGIGTDTAQYSGNYASYSIVEYSGYVTVTGAGFVDRLEDIEYIAFDDIQYEVGSVVVDDVPGETDTTATLSVGQTFNGSLEVAEDWDWFAVNFVSGQTYSVTMSPGTLYDPYISLADASGNIVYSVDIGYGGQEETFIWTADYTGSGFIIADSYYNNISVSDPDFGVDSGTYSLTFDTYDGAIGVVVDETPSNGASPWVDSLTYGTGWTSVSGSPVTTITYTFASGSGGEVSGLAWDTASQMAFETAIAQYEAIANIDFVYVADVQDANMVWWLGSDADFDSNILGYHSLPGVGSISSIGAFNTDGYGWTNQGLVPGGNGYVTIIHELGHGLGLDHPHDAAVPFPGVTSPFDDYGTFELNQGIWTTMSYNSGWPSVISPVGETAGYEGTPMALDVAAIQEIYGANLNYNTGNDVYLLSDVLNQAWYCVWDAGGTDMLSGEDLSDDLWLDLRSATLVDANAGGFVSCAVSHDPLLPANVGGFTIANGVTIENATGGSGNDVLVGNDVANILYGLGGNDDFQGGNGNDSIYGGLGGDTLRGDAANDYLNGGGHNDQIFGNDGADLIEGDWGNDTIFGGNGNDTLRGGQGFDILYSNDGYDVLDGGEASDIYVITDSLDVISDSGTIGYDKVQLVSMNGVSLGLDVQSGIERVNGSVGSDFVDASQVMTSIILLGLAGDDSLQGGTSSDFLLGGDGDDTLIGGAGNDWLLGGSGDDEFAGGAGNDLFFIGQSGDFVFDGGDGTDRALIDTSLGLAISVGNWVNVEFVIGLSGNDTIDATGAVSGLQLAGAGGDDVLSGGNGADTLIGGDGNDALNGGGQSDLLLGGTGNDSLNGETGNDFLFGANGSDEFVFDENWGNDVILDWTDGVDRVNLSQLNVGGIEGLNIYQSGASVIISLIGDTANTIRLNNADVNDFEVSDFLF